MAPGMFCTRFRAPALATCLVMYARSTVLTEASARVRTIWPDPDAWRRVRTTDMDSGSERVAAGWGAGCVFGRVAAVAENGTIETAHRSRETLKEIGFIRFFVPVSYHVGHREAARFQAPWRGGRSAGRAPRGARSSVD
ncbi:hypothetical protein GLI01_31570 [Gluconacetobacter liquefaciens]|nr:hypothetical protein GLI01_31570 [Gluconacetobacter liquefaciens]